MGYSWDDSACVEGENGRVDIEILAIGMLVEYQWELEGRKQWGWEVLGEGIFIWTARNGDG